MGTFTYIAPLGRRKTGDQADNCAGGKYKYRQIRFMLDGKRIVLLGHHVAWFLHTGSWPIQGIDHFDGVGSNTKFSNLRLATTNQNSYNQKVSTRNKSKVKGVNVINVTNAKGLVTYSYWTARISVNGIRHELGTFNDYDDAVVARLAAEEKYYGDRSFLARPNK